MVGPGAMTALDLDTALRERTATVPDHERSRVDVPTVRRRRGWFVSARSSPPTSPA